MKKSELKQLIRAVINEVQYASSTGTPKKEEYSIAVPKTHAQKAFAIMLNLQKNRKNGLSDVYQDDKTYRVSGKDKNNWVDIDFMGKTFGGIDIEDIVALLEKNGIPTQ